MPATITLPGLEEVAELFKSLFDEDTEIAAATESKRDVLACYVDEAGAVRRVLACDFAFANSAGAALSMIPAGIAAEATAAGEVPENILGNLHEVLNICVNLFADGYGGHIVLGDILLGDALAKNPVTLAETISFSVQIPRYGTGTVVLAEVEAS